MVQHFIAAFAAVPPIADRFSVQIRNSTPF